MALSLPKGTTALIVLDCQNETLHPEGAFAQWGSFPAHLLPNLRTVTDAARSGGLTIVFIRHAYRSDYADMHTNFAFGDFVKSVGALRDHEWGSEVVAELAPRPSEFEVVKTRGSAFYGSALDGVLKSNGITDIVLTGVATNGGGAYTAYDACDRGYRVTVISDASAGNNPAAHDVMCAEVFTMLGQVGTAQEFVTAVS